MLRTWCRLLSRLCRQLNLLVWRWMQPPHYHCEPLNGPLSPRALELQTWTPFHTHSPLPSTHTYPQGLNLPKDSDQMEAAALAVNWRGSCTISALWRPSQLLLKPESSRSSTGTPSLVDVIQPRPTSPTSCVPKW